MLLNFVFLAALFIQIQCSGYSHKDSKIPNVADINKDGSISNIGNSQNNSGGGSVGNVLTNIANIGQSNIGSGILSNIANLGQSNIALGQNGLLTNTANIGQSNNGGSSRSKNNKKKDDEEKGFSRPCQIYDIYCIRRYFENHSNCKKAYGPVPDPVYRTQDTINFPGINLTLTSIDVLYGNLNGRIEEFYINKETDTLVLSIQFKNLTYFSQNSYYRFNRKGKEPIINNGYVYISFQSVTTTTIFPNLKNLALENSETHAYVDDPRPNYTIGGNLFLNADTSDTTVPNTQAALVATLPTSIQEYFLVDAPFYAATYIQHSICDFGIKIL